MVWLFWLIYLHPEKCSITHLPILHPLYPPPPKAWEVQPQPCVLCRIVFPLVLFCFGRLFVDSKSCLYVGKKGDPRLNYYSLLEDRVVVEICATYVQDNLYLVRHMAHNIELGPVNTGQQSFQCFLQSVPLRKPQKKTSTEVNSHNKLLYMNCELVSNSR